MNVVVHPADEGGCGSYRLIWPTEALIADGHAVTLAKDYEYRAVWQPSTFGDRIIGLADPVDADVIVLQRPLHRNRVELLRALRAGGAAVVVEIDDDFHGIHPRNAAWRSTNPMHDRDMNRDWLMRACEEADLVTVTTPALAARYGAHGRVRIIPNYIPGRYLTTRPGVYTDVHLGERLFGVTIGWSGSVATHPGDLETTGGAVAEVAAGTGAHVGVVGTGKGVARALRLPAEPPATGWVPIDAYPEALARFDVGIVPLLPSAFNEAKSWLKGLEMAAVGVPFVASSTGPYRELADLGVGTLASTRAEWVAGLTGLITDETLRTETRERQVEIARGLTIEGHAWRWAEAWSDALAYRHGRKAA